MYVAQLSAWLPEHEKSRFMLISIHSTSAENVINNELLCKCLVSERQLEFPMRIAFVEIHQEEPTQSLAKKSDK